MVMAWPGLAEGRAALAGVPVVAVAVTAVKAGPATSLVPPRVVTVTGPVGAPFGTVRLMLPFCWVPPA